MGLTDFGKQHWMLLLCFIPLGIALVMMFYFGWEVSYWWLLFVLACPLVHYWMMKEMHTSKGGKSCH